MLAFTLTNSVFFALVSPAFVNIVCVVCIFMKCLSQIELKSLIIVALAIKALQ